LNGVHFFVEHRSILCDNLFERGSRREKQMLKTLVTLMRGSTEAVMEEVADRNALLILDQQVRDATGTLDKAKRALAFVIAQDQQEGSRLARLESQIVDLEARVIAAIEAGREDLATEGATAIARLEADRDAARNARSLFAAEIAKLRDYLRQAKGRIVEIDRGRRLARATEAVRHVRRGRVEGAMPHRGTLSEAEQTLRRLQERQEAASIADEALSQLDEATAPASAVERLAAEGFGAPMHATSAQVITRLKLRASKPKLPA
jgi:phage shock protein A